MKFQVSITVEVSAQTQGEALSIIEKRIMPHGSISRDPNEAEVLKADVRRADVRK